MNFTARALMAASICAFSVTPYHGVAQEVVINHYTHKGCVTGSGEHLMPVYALDGGIARVPAGSHWDCDRVINSATQSCESAVKAPNSRQNEQFPECPPVFAAEVPACLAHYDKERRKCAAKVDGLSAAPSGMSRLDGQWLQTDTNKFGVKHIWRCQITTSGNQLTIVDEEGNRWTGTISGNRVVLRGQPDSADLNATIVNSNTIEYTWSHGRGKFERL